MENTKISKYLKNRPLPIFTDKKYNEGFEEGYKHAIQLIKKNKMQSYKITVTTKLEEKSNLEINEFLNNIKNSFDR